MAIEIIEGPFKEDEEGDDGESQPDFGAEYQFPEVGFSELCYTDGEVGESPPLAGEAAAQPGYSAAAVVEG